MASRPPVRGGARPGPCRARCDLPHEGAGAPHAVDAPGATGGPGREDVHARRDDRVRSAAVAVPHRRAAADRSTTIP